MTKNNIISAKKIIVGILALVFLRIVFKYLKSIADTSLITCDEIISVIDIILTKITNTVITNVTKNCHSKRVRYKFDCYI